MDAVEARKLGNTMLISRLVRAVQLDPQLYSEVAADKSALVQALAIIFISSAAIGVGSAGGYPGQIPYMAMMALLGRMAWIGTIYIIGTKLFTGHATQADFGAIVRVAGFASAPALIRVIAYFPPFTVIASVGAIIWAFGAMVIAVQQAFAYRRISHAVGLIFLGWFLFQALLFFA
ncbi:MAG: hypothetical protein ACE5GK_10470 [Nitrospiria bacterium]